MIIDPFGLKSKAFKAALTEKDYPQLKIFIQNDIGWLFESFVSEKSALSLAAQGDNNLLDIIKNALNTETVIQRVIKYLIKTNDVNNFLFLAKNIPNLITYKLTWKSEDKAKWSGTAFHYAAAQNKVDFIEPLLTDLKQDINLKAEPFTPLCFAARFNAFEVAKKLIEKGADVTVCKGVVLSLASWNGSEKLIDFILQQTLITREIIDSASKFPTKNVLVPNLIQQKKKVLVEAIKKNDLNIIKTYVEQNAEWLNVSLFLDKEGNHGSGKVIHLAAALGHSDIIDFICEKLNFSHPLESKNKFKLTPLLVAIARGQIEVVKKLLASGVDITAMDDNGDNALDYAITFNRDAIVDLLLKDPRITVNHIEKYTNIKPETNYLKNKMKILWEAINHNDLPTVKKYAEENINWLVAKYSQANSNAAIHLAVYLGYIDIVAFILEKSDKSILEVTEVENRTPLFFAASTGHVDIAKMLLKNGANPVAKSTSAHGYPICSAVFYNQTKIVDLLLNQSQITTRIINAAAKVEPKDGNANYIKLKCWTLVRALRWGDLTTVGEFIEQNPEWLKVKLDQRESTALHLAILSDSFYLVRWFLTILKERAEVSLLSDILDKNKFTLMDYAALTFNTDIFTEIFNYNRFAYLRSLLTKAKKEHLERVSEIENLFIKKYSVEDFEKKVEELQSSKALSELGDVPPGLLNYLNNNFEVTTLVGVLGLSQHSLCKPAPMRDINKMILKLNDSVSESFNLCANFWPARLFKNTHKRIKPTSIRPILESNPLLAANFFNDRNLYKLLKEAVTNNKDELVNILCAIPHHVVKFEKKIFKLIKLVCKSDTPEATFLDHLNSKIPTVNFIQGLVCNHGLFGFPEDKDMAATFFAKVSPDKRDPIYLHAQMELANICCLPDEHGIISSSKISAAKGHWINIIIHTNHPNLTEEEKELRADAQGNMIATYTLEDDVILEKALKDNTGFSKAADEIWTDHNIWKKHTAEQQQAQASSYALTFWTPPTIDWVNKCEEESNTQLLYPGLLS